jgi:hypothetical protein
MKTDEKEKTQPSSCWVLLEQDRDLLQTGKGAAVLFAPMTNDVQKAKNDNREGPREQESVFAEPCRARRRPEKTKRALPSSC